MKGVLIIRIKELRQARGMTQQQLADEIGVSLALISRYESGKVAPPMYRLHAIAQYFEVTLDELLMDTGRSESTSNSKSRIYTSPIKRISNYLIEQTGGFCELCGMPAPFRDENGRPYLEAHFIEPPAWGGQYNIWNVVVLCPNCNRRVTVLKNPEDERKLRIIADGHR